MSESSRENKVLVVVRLGNGVKNLRERLKWLEDELFKEVSPFKKWLILIGSTPEEMVPKWRYYPKWEALYGFLLDDGFFEHFYDKKRRFDFGLYLNLRNNRDPGLGWGMEERYDERCITRAMIFAADGNVLFGDWGYPDACHPDTTFEELRETMDLSAYMYIKVQERRYPRGNKYKNRPFVLMLDHYLKPTEAEKPALLEESILRIQKGVNKIHFTPEQLKYALWNARFQMYFASDGFHLVHHRWKYFQELQVAIVMNYIRLRGWYVSSTWLEKVLDLFLIFITASLFAIMSGIIQQQEGFRAFIWLEVKYVLWIAFWETLFIERKSRPEDRLTVRKFGHFLIQYVLANAFVENVRFFLIYAIQGMIQEPVPLLFMAGWAFLSSSDALFGYLLWDDRYRNPLMIVWQGLCLSLVSLYVPVHDIEKMARLGMIINGLGIPFFAAMILLPLQTIFFRTSRFNYQVDMEFLRSVWVIPLCTCTFVYIVCFSILFTRPWSPSFFLAVPVSTAV